jgi:hypothetical protein
MAANLKAAAKKLAAAKATTKAPVKEAKITRTKAAAKKAPAKKSPAKTAPASPAKTSRRTYTMSTRLATGHVRRNLARYRRDPLTPEWVGWNLDDEALFAREVKNYLVDKTTLSTSTLDAADYSVLLEEYRNLAQWKPKRPKATVRKPGAAVKAASSAMEKMNVRIEITDEPAVPAPRRKDVPVRVEVSVPPLTRVSLRVDDEAPSRENRRVPENWRHLAEHANFHGDENHPNAKAAQKWWAEHCAKRMRGEV